MADVLLNGAITNISTINGVVQVDRSLSGKVDVTVTATGNITTAMLTNQLANAKCQFFVFSDKCYVLDGNNLFVTEGTAATTVAVTGYVPTITLTRSPAGGGTSYENLNYLSDSFIDSFSGKVGETAYQLSFSDLTSVDKVMVNGIVQEETTDYTVDLVVGTVTFNVAPDEGADNVKIQATKNGLMDNTKIKKCRYVCLYGGANDTRVFLTGNPDSPSTVYWSALENPAYWPEENYNNVGSDADHNTGMIVQYQSLVLLKERSIYRIEYDVFNNIATFPSYPINSVIGCDMPYSIQLIDNNVVFCNSYAGVHVLTRTDVREEKNVKPLSANINGVTSVTRPGLLTEDAADLRLATSVDYDGKYIICVGDKAWAWDYRFTPYNGNEDSLAWFPLGNINANCWLVRDGTLFLGDRTNGVVQRFSNNLNDNGEAINAVWQSKPFHFGYPEWLKTIREVYFRSREVANTRIAVQYWTNQGLDPNVVYLTSASFDWDFFSWDLFTWDVHYYPPVFKLRPKIKKTNYFQFQVSNNTVNQNLFLQDLTIYYLLTKKTR